MPNKAFLHKKSLIDKFRDDHKKGTGYIQAARARRTWNNPMTRRKRTNKLNDWITSFAGKRHIRKLSRFNALKESNATMDDTKAFIKYTDDVLDILTTKYDVSRDELKSPLFMNMFDYIDSYWYLEKTPEDCAQRLSKVFSLKVKSESCNESAPTVHIGSCWLKSKGISIVNRLNKLVSGLNGAVEYVADADGGCKIYFRGTEEALYRASRKEGWDDIVAEMDSIKDYKPKYDLDKVEDTARAVRKELVAKGDDNYLSIDNLLRNGDYQDLHDWLVKKGYMDKSEAKDTEEKLGYEKGHKNSRGEDAPWVIRSHKDNRVLASFASEEDAKEHLKRMKQFSKEETKKSEAVKLTYVDTIRVPQWMWVADQTGDTSDLEDDEIEMLKEFQLEYKDKHLDDKGEDPYFSSRNDFDSLGGNVYDIDVYEMDTKAEKVSKMKESKQTQEFPYKFKFNFYSTRTVGYVEDAIKELGIGDVQDIPEDGLFVYVKEPTDILKVVHKAIAIGNEAGSDLSTGDMYRTVGSANKYGILAYGDREVVEDAGTEYGVSWTYFDLAKDDSDNYIQAIGELDDIVDFFIAIK